MKIDASLQNDKLYHIDANSHESFYSSLNFSGVTVLFNQLQKVWLYDNARLAKVL